MENEELNLHEEKEESLDELLERINNADNNTNNFTVQSDIGKDDYRAFLYYSVLGKSRGVQVGLVLVPAIIAFFFAFKNGSLNILNFVIFTLVLWALVFGVIIYRTESSLKKIGKNNPETLRITKTSYNFRGDSILHTKNGETISVPYKNMNKVGFTKERCFLYFEGRKGMIIRNEDIEKVMNLKEFDSYITGKVFR